MYLHKIVSLLENKNFGAVFKMKICAQSPLYQKNKMT